MRLSESNERGQHSTSFGMMGFGHLNVLKQSLSTNEIEKKSASRDIDCQNFSGNWEGTCHDVIDGEEQESTGFAHIHQDSCASITFWEDSTEYRIGTVYQKNANDLANGQNGQWISHPTTTSTEKLMWNSEKTELVLSGDWSMQPGTPEFKVLSAAITGRVKINYDGDLVISSQIEGYGSSICVMSKQ